MFSAQSKTDKTRLCKQNSSRSVAASPFNKLNGWEQCFKSFSSSPYICVNISFLYHISRDKDSISDIFFGRCEKLLSWIQILHDEKKNKPEKRACNYAYSVTYFNIHNKKFFNIWGNEDWWDPWGHKNRMRRKRKSSDFLCHGETGTCQAGPAVQTPALNIAMEGWGPARGEWMLQPAW